MLLMQRVTCTCVHVWFVRCGERDFMDAIIRKAIVAKDINHRGQGLWVMMRKLPGDFAQVNCPPVSLGG